MSKFDSKYQAFFENSADAMLIIDNGEFVDCNPAAVAMLGYDAKAELINTPPHKLSPDFQPDGRSSFDKAEEMMQLARQRGSHRFEWDHLRKDGSIIPVEVSLTAIETETGFQLHTVWRDISARKEAEREREESEARFKALNEASFGGVFIHDNGLILDCNQGLAEMTGYAREELVGMDGFRLITPDCLPLVLNIIRSGYSQRYELEGVRKDGSRYPLAVRGKEITYLGRKVRVAEFRDLTEIKKTQEALRESEEKFRAWVDTSPLTIYVSTGDEQKAVYVNPAFIKLFGYAVEEVPTLNHWWPLAYPDEGYRGQLLAEWQRKVATALQNNSAIEPMETLVTCKDGSTRNVSWGYIPIGKQNWMFGVDLTERKHAERDRQRLEKQLFQSQKMEAIGILAGGIAHDFNNLLAIIRGSVELLQRQRKDQDGPSKNIEQIHKAVDRASNLVAQILAFSRQKSHDLEPVDLTAAVDEDLNLLRSTIPTTIEIFKTFDNDPIIINADKTQLQQIMINLCTNAVHAMNEKGLLQVNIGVEVLSADNMPAGQDPLPGKYARLSVSDTGIGMDQATLARIFDPFFTTKPVGLGTGMGLSAAHGIMASHGGFITVDSTPGEGTTFNLYFPVISETEIASPGAEPVFPTGTERVLFVDDEEYVAAIGSDMLEYLGYRVTCQTSSKQALALFRADPRQFDLVFTDQTMPEMSGTELAAELLQIRPDIPIILCSGYSSKVSEDNFREMGVRRFCQKPMDMEAFARAAREVLDGSGNRA